MKALTSYHVSATLIVIENRNGYANDSHLTLVYALLSNKDQLTYEFLFSRIIDQRNSVNLILSPLTANLGGAEFRPLVCQKTTKTRTRLFTRGWSCFSDCRCCLRMTSVGLQHFTLTLLRFWRYELRFY